MAGDQMRTEAADACRFFSTLWRRKQNSYFKGLTFMDEQRLSDR